MRTMQWVMSQDALPLSYRRLKGAKTLKLNVDSLYCDIHPGYC